MPSHSFPSPMQAALPIPRTLAFGLSCAALCAPLAAQDDLVTSPDATTIAEGDRGDEVTARRTFTPDDFSRFAPRTAFDMARRVPGFSIQEGDGARGLGQADTNVLINGRRISGKSNGPVEALQRIPAEEVLGLELVDGASLDIGGLSGQVLNVLTASSGKITGQWRINPEFRSRGTPARLLDGEVSIAGGGQKNSWTLALENSSNRRGNDGVELVFDGAGNLIDTRDEQANFNSDRISLSGSFARTATNGNVLNLTGEVQGFFFRQTETSDRSGTIDTSDRSRIFKRSEDEFNFELGGDYEFKFGPGRLKLIGYHRYEDSPTTSDVVTSFSDGRPQEGTVFDRDADEAETIARAEYSIGALGGDLLFAAEGVRNFLDINSTLDERDDAGILQPVEFDGASARVEEDRADFGLTYSRQMLTNLQLQASAGGEYSQLSQTGELGQTREFWRPKGFVSLDWKASDRFNLSGRIEREVGQLNFFDFIASVDLDQERENDTNAELVPPQSWVFEIEANVNLGDLGTLSVRPFYEDISDIVDQIPTANGGQAVGNLPSAQFYGVESNLTLLSEGFGWRGSRLDVEFALNDSEVLDPLLGTPRQLSNNTTLELETRFRHDLQSTDWAVGAFLNYEEFTQDVRLDEVAQARDTFAFLLLFVENKDVAGLTIRASVRNLLDRKDLFDRTVFIDRAAGIADFVEARDRSFGTIFNLAIEGSF
ncbi:MAG: TonB-dependent receptor plug domain-containing protein [Pseudomonadota bacterium]